MVINTRDASFQQRVLLKTFKSSHFCLCLHEIGASEKCCVENSGKLVFPICLQKSRWWGALVGTLQSVLAPGQRCTSPGGLCSLRPFLVLLPLRTLLSGRFIWKWGTCPLARKLKNYFSKSAQWEPGSLAGRFK